MPSSTSYLGPAGHDYTKLAEVLKGFARETLVFVPNPGNAGDALINLGMYELFQDLGVKWEMGSFSETYQDRVVIFSGGGALVSVYPDADVFFRRNHPVCKALILLPHTVLAYEKLLSEMDGRCYLFAREQLSHAFLEKHATGGAHVALAHDMAFYLSKEKIAGLPWDWEFLTDPSVGPAWAKMLTKITILNRLKTSTLNVIRDDVESTTVEVPSNNFDLSTLFATGHLQEKGKHMTPGVCASTTKALRLLIDRYDLTDTNRLHIAILCALLHKKVKMRDNSYGKNSSIYQHSIKSFYPHVDFIYA
jgi:exopolysaccharide biosynthesis predicted pyruvyltransferase EpsI